MQKAPAFIAMAATPTASAPMHEQAPEQLSRSGNHITTYCYDQRPKAQQLDIAQRAVNQRNAHHHLVDPDGCHFGKKEQVTHDGLNEKPEESPEDEFLINLVRFHGLPCGFEDDDDEHGDGGKLGTRRQNSQAHSHRHGLEQFRTHARGNADQHQVERHVGQVRPPQRNVFEAWERLVGKAHHEQSHPPENHGMRVRLDGGHQANLQKGSAQGNLQ